MVKFFILFQIFHIIIIFLLIFYHNLGKYASNYRGKSCAEGAKKFFCIFRLHFLAYFQILGGGANDTSAPLFLDLGRAMAPCPPYLRQWIPIGFSRRN